VRCPNGYARYFCCVGRLVLRFRNFCGSHFVPAHFRSAGRDNLPGSLKCASCKTPTAGLWGLRDRSTGLAVKRPGKPAHAVGPRFNGPLRIRFVEPLPVPRHGGARPIKGQSSVSKAEFNGIGGLRTYFSFTGPGHGSENWSVTCWCAQDLPRLQLQ
jgi:hypothetical protein